MKIIEIVPRLQTGGAEKFVVDLTNKFAAQGHHCVLLTLFDLDEFDIVRNELSDQVELVSIGKHRGFDLRCYGRILQIIRRYRPDVVHAHVGAIKYLTLSTLLYRKCRYFATIHSEARREAGRGIELWSRKLMFNNRLMVPITISEESGKSFQQFYGWAAPMIMNGCSKYTPSQNMEQYLALRESVDLLFVHAARISDVKNQPMLLRVFQRLLSEGLKIRLLIMGRCDSDKIMADITAALCDGITYLGERADIRDIMAVADAFCLTSRQEGMPITIIEAFSVGCPPITTPVGGCVNMIQDGQNGLLSSDCSDEQYYKTIKQYIFSSDERRKLMKSKAFDSYRAYSITTTARNYLALFSHDNDKN